MGKHVKGEHVRGKHSAIGVAIGCIAAVMLLLSGCGPNESSRAKMYDSEQQLAKDSTVIVVGNVDGQTTLEQGDDGHTKFTVSSVIVAEKIKGGGDADIGKTIQVRQTGVEDGSQHDPILQDDVTYLLYLSPSGLSGDAAAQYYVTGATAGMYMADTNHLIPDRRAIDTLVFKRVDAQSGDKLPEHIQTSQISKD